MSPLVAQPRDETDTPHGVGPDFQVVTQLIAQTKEHYWVPVSRRRESLQDPSQIESVLIWLSSRKVILAQWSGVRDYLTNHPDVVGLVLSVCEKASKRFGMNAQLSLEVYRDPEVEDAYLTFYVRQQPYDEKILDVIGEINREFELELADKSGWLVISTDFRPPR